MKNNFKRKVLKNGLTILFEKRNVPVVSIAFAVRSGGINEKKEEKGISHFIEHMLYKGTKTRTAKKIAEEIERNGGILNGFTTEEVTAFYCKMPGKNAEIGLKVLADIIKDSLFDEKELEKERKVIFEEIKMRKDSPKIYVFDKIQSLLYESPFGDELIGTQKTINSITKKKMIERFKKVYTSDNMILSVVGDYDFDKLVKFVEKNFGLKNKKDFIVKVVKKNESLVEEREGIDQANLILAYHSPLFKDEKSYAAVVLSAILGGGMSSRLFSEIREKRNLAYSVHSSTHLSKDFSYSTVYVGTTKKNVKEVKNLILKEFEKVSKNLREKELNNVKSQINGNHQISMEDSTTQMTNLLFNEVMGSASEYYDFEEKILKVKIEDVKNLAKSVAEGNYSFFALVPKDDSF